MQLAFLARRRRTLRTSASLGNCSPRTPRLTSHGIFISFDLLMLVWGVCRISASFRLNKVRWDWERTILLGLVISVSGSRRVTSLGHQPDDDPPGAALQQTGVDARHEDDRVRRRGQSRLQHHGPHRRHSQLGRLDLWGKFPVRNSYEVCEESCLYSSEWFSCTFSSRSFSR